MRLNPSLNIKGSDKVNNASFLALMFFIFSVPWENSVFIENFGTISRVAGIGAIIFGIFNIIINNVNLRIDSFQIFVFVFFYWCIFSFFWSINKEESILGIQTIVQLFIMVILLSQYNNSISRLNMILASYVAGSFISAASIIIEYIKHNDNVYSRFAARGFDPNDIALVLALSIPIAWYLSKNYRSLIKTTILLHILFAILAIFFTGSRGGFIVMLIGLGYILYSISTQSKKGHFLKVSVFLIMFFALLQFMPFASVERIKTIPSQLLSGDLSQRGEIWFQGLEVFSKNPIIGIGEGGFKSSVRPYFGKDKSAHSLFMSILVEKGIVGLFLFLCIIAFCISKITILDKGIKHFTIILMLSLMIGVMAIGWEHKKVTWIILTILIGFGSLGKNCNEKGNSVHTQTHLRYTESLKK